MAWAIVAAVAGIIAILLLSKIRLCIKLHLGRYFVEIGLCFRLFFNLIPINLRYRIEYEPCDGIRVMRYERGGGLRVLKIIGEKKKKNTTVDKAVIRAIRSGMTVEAVEVTGEIGIPSDAFVSVISAGVIRIAIDTAIRLGLPLALDKKQPERLIVNFFPCLTRRTFNLKLEGILSAIPLKLIKNAVAAAAAEKAATAASKAVSVKKHKGEK